VQHLVFGFLDSAGDINHMLGLGLVGGGGEMGGCGMLGTFHNGFRSYKLPVQVIVREV